MPLITNTPTRCSRFERQEELLDATDYWDDSFIAGAFTVPGAGGDWTLVPHFDGGVGMQRRFLEVAA